MELKWLEDFISLADTRSFSRAAEARNVTQPAFSRRIKALEFWLGTPLFDRSTFPTTLTPAGAAFRETAEEVLRKLHDARTDVRAGARETKNAIRVAVPHTLSLTFLPKWLKEVETGIGPIATRIAAENVHDCVQALSDGACDLLICFHRPDIPIVLNPARFPSFRLGADRVLPVSAPDGKRRARYTLPGTARQPLPYLAYGSDSYLGRVVDRILETVSTPPRLRRHYENSMAASLKAMAVEGHGIAWLPESLVEGELTEGTLARAGDASWDALLDVRIYRSLSTPSPITDTLWSFITGSGKFN